MRATQQHKIRHLNVEIEAEWESSAQGIRDRVTKMFQQNLAQRLDRILSDLYEPETLIKIDNLNIDLGDIAEEEFEQEFEERIEAVLRKILEGVAQSQNGHQAIKTEVKTELDVLEFHLLHGGIPWWWQDKERISLKNLIQRLLQKDKTAFQKMLQNLIGNGQAIRRLVQHSTKEVRLEICKILLPDNFKENLEDWIATFFRREKALGEWNISKTNWEEMVWESVLKAILSEDSKELQFENLQQASIEYLAQASNVQKSSLEHVLLMDTDSKAARNSNSNFTEYQAQKLAHESILNWLEKGFGSGKEKKRRIAALLQLPKIALAAMVRDAGILLENRLRWEKELSESEISHLLHALAGNAAEKLALFETELAHIVEKIDVSVASRNAINSKTSFWILEYWLRELPSSFEQQNILAHLVGQMALESQQSKVQISTAIVKAVTEAISEGKIARAWPLFLPQLPQMQQLAVLDQDSRLPDFAEWLETDLRKPEQRIAILAFAKTENGQILRQLLPPKQQNQLLKLASPQLQKYVSALKNDIRFLAKKQKLNPELTEDWISEAILEIVLTFPETVAPSQSRILQELLFRIANFSGQSLDQLRSSFAVQAQQFQKSLQLGSLFATLLVAPKSQNTVQATLEPSAETQNQSPKNTIPLGDENQISVAQKAGLDRPTYLRLQPFIQEFEAFIQEWKLAKIDPEKTTSLFWNLVKIQFSKGDFGQDLLPFFRSFIWEWLRKASLSMQAFLEHLQESIADAAMKTPISDDWFDLLEALQQEAFSSTGSRAGEAQTTKIAEANSFNPKELKQIAAKKWLHDAFEAMAPPAPEADILGDLLEVAAHSPQARQTFTSLASEWSRDEKWIREIAALPKHSRAHYISIFAPLYQDWLIQVVEAAKSLHSFLQELARKSEIGGEFPTITETQIWEIVLSEISAIRFGQDFQENILRAIAATLEAPGILLENALQNPIATQGKNSELIQFSLETKQKDEISASGSLAQFLLEGKLPLNSDLGSLQKRLLEAARQTPNATKTFLQKLGRQEEIAQRLNLFLPPVDFFSILAIFGRFNVLLLQKVVGEMAIFAASKHKSAGKIFQTQLMAIAMSKGFGGQTSSLIEAAFLATARKIKLSFSHFLLEIVEMNTYNKAALPNLAQIAFSIEKKTGNRISSTQKESIQDKNWESQLNNNLLELSPDWLDKLIAQKPKALILLFQAIKALKKSPKKEAFLKQLKLRTLLSLLQIQYPSEALFFEDLQYLLVQVVQAGNRLQLAKDILRTMLTISLQQKTRLEMAVELAFEEVFSTKTGDLKQIAQLVETLSPLFEYSGTRGILVNTVARRAKTIAKEESLKAPKVQSKGPKWAEEATPNFDLEYALPNAGVVLIWPFFTRYFEILGLLDAGQFRSETTQERAIFLLCYLCNGNIAPNEADLVFPKLLCGFPPSKPTKKRRIRLKKKEKEMTLSLLNAIVSHWKVLGETKPETLQETFLNRGGQLKHTEKQWLLRVDSKSPDLLLRTLPWGISPVKFAWMEKMLNVEWT